MLRQRFATGCPIGLLTLMAFLVPGRIGETVFMALALAFSTLAVFEFMNLTRSTGLPGYPRITAGAVAVVIGIICFRGMAGRPGLAFTGLWSGVLLEVLVFIVFLAVVMTQVARSHDYSATFKRFLVSVAALAIVIGTLGFIPRLYFLTPGQSTGRYLLLYLLLVTKFADMGAYAFGMWTSRRPQGNHKMIPSISPKKSWEGFVVGTITAIVVAWIFLWMVPAETLFAKGLFARIVLAAVFGALCSAVGLLGDLGESLFKRATGAKDSGDIPGLGGVLDVLDSLILAVPLFYIFVSLKLYAL